MKHSISGYLLGVFASIILQHFCRAQAVPGFGPVFAQDEVSAIYITIDPDSLADMIDNLENVHEYPAEFSFSNSAINESVSNIGFRLRGNTSLTAQKKSFKISFNTFDNVSWHGLEKMNLIAQVNDPSLIRSKLCHDMYRHYGIHAARTSFVKLYINNEYRGLYLNVEHLDENYASRAFDEQGDGNLYKCTYPADLDYISDNPDDYKFANWGTRHYELQTNEWADDYSDLAHFIDVLNNTPSAQLQCELPKVFDIESYLKTAAVDILMGSWDNYIYLKNNFYLYHHQLSNRFVYLPYDLDNTLGIDWVGQDWAVRNLYNWNMTGEERPLYTRILANNYFKNRFSYYINQFCSEYFTTENITAQAQQWQDLITSAVQEDVYYPLDNGYTFDDFQNAITDAWGQQVNYSIADYVETRRAAALNQLAPYSSIYTTLHWTNALNVTDSAEDMPIIASFISLGSENCDLHISTDNTSWQNTADAWSDNGINPDDAIDSIYTFGQILSTAGDKLFYETQINGNSNECLMDFMWTSPSQTELYINEVMASNTSVIADNFNEYDDWVELWNGSNEPINLEGKFLTDDIFDWNKYPLPALEIPAGAHFIFWLDNDEEQGEMHGTFRLNAGDTAVWLISLEENKPRLMDEFYPVTFGQNIASSRYPDGSSNIIAGLNASPGATNIPLSTDEVIDAAFSYWPNPTSHRVFFNHTLAEASMIDLHGHVVRQCQNCNTMTFTGLADGVYFIREGNNFHRLIVSH